MQHINDRSQKQPKTETTTDDTSLTTDSIKIYSQKKKEIIQTSPETKKSETST